MAKKRYVSGRVIGLSVSLGGNRGAHVPFTPLSGGGSYYVTDSAEVQAGLEGHYLFGSLFRLDASSPEGDGPSAESASPEKPREPEGPRVVRVTDLNSAKDFLADRFGILRHDLRNKSSILRKAEEFGVRFEGLD